MILLFLICLALFIASFIAVCLLDEGFGSKHVTAISMIYGSGSVLGRITCPQVIPEWMMAYGILFILMSIISSCIIYLTHRG
jgi:hypothetical protein